MSFGSHRTQGRVFIGCEAPPELKQALVREVDRRRRMGRAVSESDLVREALTRFLLSSSIPGQVMEVKTDTTEGSE